MGDPVFVLDANVFIEAARRYYAFDLAPKFPPYGRGAPAGDWQSLAHPPYGGQRTDGLRASIALARNCCGEATIRRTANRMGEIPFQPRICIHPPAGEARPYGGR